MAVLLPALFAALLFFDIGERDGRERVLYLALSAVAVILSVFAGIAASSDHVGASLSGMISIFMR